MSDGPSDLAADADGVVVVTSGRGVRALDPAGHVRWSVRLDGLVAAPPALGSDVVLVGGAGLGHRARARRRRGALAGRRWAATSMPWR